MPQLDHNSFANLGESGKHAGSLAESAKLGLSAMVENRRRQVDAWVRRFEELKGIIVALRQELAGTRRELAEVVLENDTLKKNHVVLMQNQRRLYLGFVSLLKSVEDTCGAEVGIDQRIEAALLSADMGNVLGDPADVSTAKAREFLAATEPTRMSSPPENPHA